MVELRLSLTFEVNSQKEVTGGIPSHSCLLLLLSPTLPRLWQLFFYQYYMPSFFVSTRRSSSIKLVADWHRLSLALALLLGGASAAQAQNQTPFGKNDSRTYLLEDIATKGYTLDFTAGSTNLQGTGNNNGGTIYVSPSGTAAQLNAAGFNYVDGYIWAQDNGTNQLVRIGTEYVGKPYTFTQPTGYTETTFTVGDVNVTGKMYMTRGGSAEGNTKTTTDVYVIDLTQTATPLVATEITFPYRSYITDWAFSPKDTCLYAINTYFNNTDPSYANNENNTKIYRFVTHRRKFNGVVSEAGTRETLGVATGGSTAIAPANSFYVVANGTGLVHRIDHPERLPAIADGSATSKAIPATYIGKFTAGLGNNTDGARNAFSLPATGALPVQLADFTATATPSRSVQLAWATASELNSSFFEVQHSLDGRTFAAVGQVAGHGNSIQPLTYSFTDTKPSAAATNYYRLRQVDLDGTSTFSPVQAVTLAAGSSPVQFTAAPNPTTPGNLHLQVQYQGQGTVPAVLTVQSLLGQTLYSQAVILQPGTSTLSPTSTLAPGIYWLSLSSDALPNKLGTRVMLTN
jgi:hypothetical protein